MDVYLQPTSFINWDADPVKHFALENASEGKTQIERAIILYTAVRDGIPYNPHGDLFDRNRFIASNVLNEESTFCIPKGILLVACARFWNIPARLGFADVKNHLAPQKLLEIMKTDIFYFHGFVELFLAGKWVKATPAFDVNLCKRYGVKPLEFDGIHDSVFQPFNTSGNQFMEYIHEYGSFADMPFELMVTSIKNGYPHIFEHGGFAAYAAAVEGF